MLVSDSLNVAKGVETTESKPSDVNVGGMVIVADLRVVEGRDAVLGKVKFTVALVGPGAPGN